MHSWTQKGCCHNNDVKKVWKWLNLNENWQMWRQQQKKFADLIIMLKTFAISMAFTRKSKCTNMKVDKQMWICETRKLPEKKARRRWRRRKKTKNAQLWASYKYALQDEILPSWFEAFSNSSATHRASHFPLKKHPCHFTLYLSPSLVYMRQSDSGSRAIRKVIFSGWRENILTHTHLCLYCKLIFWT